MKISQLIQSLGEYDSDIQVSIIVTEATTQGAFVSDPNCLILCKLKDGTPYLEIAVKSPVNFDWDRDT
jgi:hypothetical protein